MAAVVSQRPTGDPEFYDLEETITYIDGAASPVVTTDIQTGFVIGPTEEQIITASWSRASNTNVQTWELEVRATAWRIPALATVTEVLSTNGVPAAPTVTTFVITGSDPISTGVHTLPASGADNYSMTVDLTIHIPHF